MKIKTLVEFSGVPKGTTGTAEKDEKLWKITWNLNRTNKLPNPLVDWFSEDELKNYLEVIEN